MQMDKALVLFTLIWSCVRFFSFPVPFSLCVCLRITVTVFHDGFIYYDVRFLSSFLLLAPRVCVSSQWRSSTASTPTSLRAIPVGLP